MKKKTRISIPANEAWLWKNKNALAMVQEAITEARQRRHAKPPNMAEAKRLAAKITRRHA
jgi:hypothetical protein